MWFEADHNGKRNYGAVSISFIWNPWEDSRVSLNLTIQRRKTKTISFVSNSDIYDLVSVGLTEWGQQAKDLEKEYTIYKKIRNNGIVACRGRRLLGDTDRRLRTFQRGKEVVGIRKMRCSNGECRKRVCDIWETRFGVVVIELKCRHCGEVVRVYWKPKGKK